MFLFNTTITIAIGNSNKVHKHEWYKLRWRGLIGLLKLLICVRSGLELIRFDRIKYDSKQKSLKLVDAFLKFRNPWQINNIKPQNIDFSWNGSEYRGQRSNSVAKLFKLRFNQINTGKQYFMNLIRFINDRKFMPLDLLVDELSWDWTPK